MPSHWSNKLKKSVQDVEDQQESCAHGETAAMDNAI
jgi:hypothetical protein